MNLNQVAKEYRDRYGFSVFPVILSYKKDKGKYDKKPAVSTWLPFNEKFPTDKEIDIGFSKSGVNAIGLVTGKISGITVLDWDSKEECPYKSPVMVKTISGGKHIYFKYKEGVRNTVRVGGRDLDVRGEHGFVVIPPSGFNEHTYSWEIEGDLGDRLKELPEFPQLSEKVILAKNFNLPLDVQKCLRVKIGSRDDKLYRLACSLVQKHPEDESWGLLLASAKTYEGFGETFTEVDVRAKYSGAYKFIKGKEKLFNQRTDKKKNSTKENDKNLIITSFFETNDYILEEIRCPVTIENTANHENLANPSTIEQTLLKFIKYSKLDSSLSIVDEEKIGEKTVKPITNELAQNGIVNFPTISFLPIADEFAEFAKFAPLVSDIQDFFDIFFEVPEFERKFLPYYVLFTWVYEKFDFIPYLQFCGLTGTGKTRTGETVAGLCYKSIDVRGSASISAIFRMADEWKGTLFIDEFDMDSFGRDNYGAALAFLKSGVGDGSVLRVEGTNKRTVVAYSVKSPKVFTSERPINDAGLQSRTYVIEMESSKKRLPLFKIKNKYNTKLNELRTRLLYWRLINLNKIDLSKIEWGFPELACFDKRVQQVITPIYYLADEESRKSVLKFAQEQEESTFSERREALAGIVFEVIKEMDNNEPEFSEVRKKVNDRLENDGLKLITVKALGKILKISLHFETQKVGHDHITKVTWEKDKFDAMLKYYGYKEQL